MALVEFDVLSQDEAIYGMRFLEASAGTGKTFSIEHLFTRFILDEERSIEAEEILVITFTRAATRELKSRIRGALASARDQLLSGDIIHDYLKKYDQKALVRIEHALSVFDQVAISTIHGFCYKSLTEFAFESGVDMRSADPDEGDVESILIDAAREFLLGCVDESFISTNQMRRCLSYHRRELDSLIRALVTLSQKGKHDAPITSFEQLYQQAQVEVQKHKVDAHNAMTDYLKVKQLYKRMTSPHLDEQALKLFTTLESGKMTRSQFDALLNHKEFFLEFMCTENRKVRAKDVESLNYPGLIDALRQTLYPIIAVALDPLQITVNLAVAFAKEWEGRCEELELFTPDNLLDKMAKAAHLPAFLTAMHQRYRVAIIDEFQDTDALQWAIFKRLFIERDEALDALYLVGDPKQSIYAFRNADLYTYLEAARTLGEENHRLLGTNFRSQPALIHALNTLFTPPFAKKWLNLPKVDSYLPYHPVKPSPTAQDKASNIGSMHFHIVKGRTGRERRFPTKAMNLEISRFIVSESLRLKSEGASLSEIAVLVKDRFQAEIMQRCFKDAGVSAYIRKREDLSKTRGFRLFESLLKLLCEDRDLRSLPAILATPLFADQPHDEMMYRFLSLRSTLFEEGFTLFFQELMNEEMRSSLPIDLYTEVCEIADHLAACGQSHPMHLLHTLRKWRSSHESLPFMRPSDGDQVQIMTVHMSKGLEFTYVFHPGLATRHSKEEELIYLHDRRELALAKEMHVEADALIDERDAEKMRYLYVALTRAKRRNYLSIALDEEQKRPKRGLASPIELFFDKMGLSFSEFIERYQKAASVTVGEIFSAVQSDIQADIDWIKPLDSTFAFDSRLMQSFTALSKKAHVPGVQIIGELEGAHAIPQGAETGVILHSIFEELFARGRDVETIVCEKVKMTFLQPWSDAITQLIHETLDLVIDGFTLREALDFERLQEVEFLMPSGDTFIKGFIDLIFMYKGRLYMVDWKSNWLGSSDAFYSYDHLKQAMQSNDYFLQASIYKEALKRHMEPFIDTPFDQVYAGSYYIFLRGKGIINAEEIVHV